MRVRIWRGLAIVAATAIALVIVAVLTVHTPWTRARVLGWAAGFVTRYQLSLEAGQLDYNALTRRAMLTDVRLAAIGHEDTPFLIARRIEVRLPWLVYGGRFAIDRLDIDGGVVNIVRDEQGMTNLPPGDPNAPTPQTPRRLDVRGLGLRGFDVKYTDRLRDFDLTVPRIDADLSNRAPGAMGLFAVRGDTTLRYRDRTLTFAPMETQLAFDGSNVSFDAVRMWSAEVDALVKGRVIRALDAPSLNLSIDGSVDLAPAAAWVEPPVPVAGVARINGTLNGPATAFTMDLATGSENLSVGLERGLRLEGPVRVTLDAATSDGVTLTPSTGGSLRAAFNVPFGDEPSRTSAEWQGVDAHAAFRLIDLESLPISSTLDGKLTFETGRTRRLALTNRATARAARRDAPVSGTLTASLVGDAWTADHAHRMDGMVVDGRLQGVIKSGVGSREAGVGSREAGVGSREAGVGDAVDTITLGGGAHVLVVDLDAASHGLAAFGFDLPQLVRQMRGAVDVPLVLSGTFADPLFRGRMSVEALEVPSIGDVRGSASVDGSTRSIMVSSIDLTRGTASITGQVNVDIAKDALTGSLRLQAADAADLQAALPEGWRIAGPIHAEATLGGSLDAFHLDTRVEGAALTLADQSLDRVTAEARLTEDAIDVSSLQVGQGDGLVTGRLRYAWEDGAYNASLKGEALTWIGSLVTDADTSVTFSAQFDGSGTTARPGGSGRIDFLVAGGTAGALVGAGDATVDLLGDQARFVAHAPSLGALVTGTVATSAPYDYRAVAALNRVNLAPLAALIDAVEGEVRGFVSLSATVSGALAGNGGPLAFANLQDLDAGIGGVPVMLASPTRVTLRDGRLAIDGVDARVGAGRLTASGEWTSTLDGEFEGRFDGALQDVVQMGRAFGVAATTGATGTLSAAFRSNGSRAGTSGALTLRGGAVGSGEGPPAVSDLEIEAALNGESLTISRIAGRVASGGIVGDFTASARAAVPALETQAVSGTLTIDRAAFTFSGLHVTQQRPSRVDFAKGRIALSDVTWVVAGNPLALSGTIDLSSEREVPVDLALKGVVDLRVLSAFSRALAFDGSADVDARVTGTTDAPVLGGRIMLADAEIAIAEPRMVLSELSGPIVLSGSTITVDGITGLANGGAIGIDGSVWIEGREIAGGTLTVNAQGVALEFPEGLRSEVDALLTITPDPRAPSITGDVRVLRGAYTDTITLAALARNATAPVGPAAQPAYLDRFHLNVSVTTAEDLAVDNNYGRFEAGATLRVVGTVAAPGMTGRVTLREAGQVYLAGRTFRITRGDVSFTDLRRIQPEFNIAAEARIGADEVTMTLTGTLDRPSLDLTSADGSRTPGELAAAIVGAGAGAQSALTLLSADLLGLSGRAIGLDTLRVERGDIVDSDFRDDPSLVANETDPATRLTIAKRLSNQVEVTLSQNLRQSGKATVIVSYFPVPTIEFRALTRDNATLGFGVRHQVTFGAGGTTRPAARAERPTVAAITFVDATPDVEAAARTRMKLRPGKRFEFLDLQRDIDAVRDALRGQGRFEARVRVRRIEGDGGHGVTLEYRVDPGPVTTLSIRGIDLPAAEIRALEDIWTRSAFDQFLIDDLTTRVRRHLVTTGNIASIVVGTVDRPSADAKRMRIDVTLGAPVSAREIRVSGNASIDAERLRSEVSAAGLDLEAWINPAAVADAVETIYREAGFLRAEVTAGPLDIDGTTGVLPVRIAEGPRARITEVRWAGVGDARVPAVQRVADLRPPTPFVSATVSEARQRVEQHYRSDGFNGATVDVEPEVADDSSVVLVFRVVEGPQQVLRDVSTAGADRTRPDVIAEALRLPVGEPVNLDDWSLARKRLYDTNVFRVVDVVAVPAGEVVDGVQPVRAQVTVQEYPAWAFRYGLQFEGERTPTIEEFASKKNFGVVAEVKNQNLLGRALTFGAFTQYEYDAREANIFLATSRLFGWRARSLLYSFARRDRLRDEAQNITAMADRIGVSAEQRWRTRAFQIVYGYRYERNHTYDPEPSRFDPFPLDFSANLGRLSGVVLLDRRDDPLNARSGTFSSVSWEQAALWLASDVTNRKLLLQQFAFVPMGPRLVLASRAQVGLVFGPDALFPSDRFRAGGATTVRGYGEDGIGPRDFFGLPEGGETLVVLNQEARVSVHKWIGAVGFVDAGNISHKGEPFSWRDLKVGYGFGLRLNTPVGLVRADVGIPADLVSPTSTRQPNNLKSVRWYVGIGHIF